MENSSQISVDKGGEKQVPGWAKNFKFTMPFHGLDFFIGLEIDAINSFIDQAENLINTKEEELEERMKSWKVEMMSHPNAPEPNEMYEQEILTVSQFRKLLYNSFFITSYSCFEKRLFEICSICKEEFELKISAKDIKGNDDLDQCKKYLEKVVEVDLAFLKTAWSDLSNYRKLRIAIVHNDGVVKNDDFQTVAHYFSNNTAIKIAHKDKSFSIESSGFIKTFNILFSKYLSDLTSEITTQKNLS